MQNMTPKNSQTTAVSVDVAHSDLLRFVYDHLQPKDGGRAAWEHIYEHFSDWWGHEGQGTMEPLSARDFADALWFICQRGGIPVQKSRGRVYCLGVELR